MLVCPFCKSCSSVVKDSRHRKSLNTIHRRRQCHKCNQRYSTYEYIEEPNKKMINLEENCGVFVTKIIKFLKNNKSLLKGL